MGAATDAFFRLFDDKIYLMAFSTSNHYVPEWYQKRFIPSESLERKYFYLDLNPEKLPGRDGQVYTRRALRTLGPASCFAQDHLYTKYFAGELSDVIERKFFGPVDSLGKKAVELFSDFTLCQDSVSSFSDLIAYLGAQTFRTPKGLDLMTLMTENAPNQRILDILPSMTGIYSAIWSEATWEIFKADDSPTKFIISDHPVTFYNKKAFPGQKEHAYPRDARLASIGTHTIFPLSLERCLVITHVQYSRNPKAPLLAPRENFRLEGRAFFDLTGIQTGRLLPENEVLAINYIIKKRARRFVAGGRKEWLYPEKYMKQTLWNQLGDRFFLMPDPRKIPFTTGISAGFSDGTAVTMDEYGRRLMTDNAAAIKSRETEFRSFREWRKEWDLRYGELSSEDKKDAAGIPRY